MIKPRRIVPPKALVPYQIRIFTAPWYDATGKAQTHTFLKARRVGGSEVCALRSTSLATGREMMSPEMCSAKGVPLGTWIPREPMDVYISSKEFKSAKDVVLKCGDNCRELGYAGDEEFQKAVLQGTKIYFPTTGKSIYAVTRTSIRGSTGAVVLDEFPHTPRQKELWGAAGLVANPTLGNDRGFPKLVVGTPWEAGSWAHEIFTGDTFPFKNNRFVVDIHKAVDEGFPIDPEQAFAELGIQELIETEYLCQWSRGGGSYFPAEKLRAMCVDDDVDLKTGREIKGLPDGWQNAPCFYGIDVGGGPGESGTGRDFTAIVQWRVIDDFFWIVGVKAFNHLDTEEQVEEMVSYIRKYPGEVRIDRGMMGKATIDLMQRRLAGRRGVEVRGAGMSRLDQEKYAGKFKRMLEGHQLRLYMGDEAGGDPGGIRALCIELSRIKGKLAGSGHLQLETPRDPMEGHCDRAWAALLGLASHNINAYTMASVSSTGVSAGYVHEVDFDHRGIG